MYIGFSMMDGTTPHPSGWVFGYYGDLSDNTNPMVYATAAGPPDQQGRGGGIWQGGGGLAAGKGTGNPYYIYFSTADGAFNSNPQSQFGNAGDSFLKLTTDLTTVSDFFTPADQWYRWNNDCKKPDGNDIDFGSTGSTVLPNGVPSQKYNLVVKSDKENYLWVLDRTNLGQFSGSGCGKGDPLRCSPACGLDQNKTVETPFLLSTSGQARSTAAFWSGAAPNSGDAGELYFAGYFDQLNRYPVNSTCPAGKGNPPVCSAAATSNADPSGNPPGLGYASTPSVSSGSAPQYANGILWALKSPDGGATNPGLYAFDAGTLNTLYDSNSCFTNDQISPVKFSVPTIANGYVFVGGADGLDIFGVLSSRSCN